MDDRRSGGDRRADNNNEKWVTGIISVAVPVIALSIGSLTTWIWKVDDRQYQLSNEIPMKYATKTDLQNVLRQFGETVNKRFDIVEQTYRDQRADRENFQNQVLEEVKATNRNVQELALKLEKRTRGE